MRIENPVVMYRVEMSLEELKDIQKCILILDSENLFGDDRLAERSIKMNDCIALERKKVKMIVLNSGD